MGIIWVKSVRLEVTAQELHVNSLITHRSHIRALHLQDSHSALPLLCTVWAFSRGSAHEIPHWRIRCVPLRYIAHDGGTHPAGLSDSPESESRNLACWHTGEGDLRPCGEPPAYSSIPPSYRSSCLSRERRRRSRERVKIRTRQSNPTFSVQTSL